MKSANRRYLPRLDMLRALAAWWVVMHHCFTMIPKSMLAETSWADSLNPVPVVVTAPWIPLTLFMVISGYSIGTGLAGHTIHWPGYLAARVLRVAPLYWFLLILGIVIGARTIAQIVGVEQDTTRSFVQSILMLPISTSYTPFPWLATAWSVRIEVVLYLFVPVMVWLLRTMQPAAAATVIAVSCLTVIGLGLLLGADAYTVLYANVPGRLLEFACGLLLAFLHGRDVPRQTAVRCGLAGVGVMTAMAYISNHAGGHLGLPGNLRGCLYVGGLISAMLLLLWANSDHDHGTEPVGRALVRLGQWSYSTYLWHFTVMTFVAIPISARLTAAWGLPVWPHLLIGLSITAAITAPLSYLSFRWIEVPFLRLRPRYVVATSQTSAAPHGHR